MTGVQTCALPIFRDRSSRRYVELGDTVAELANLDYHSVRCRIDAHCGSFLFTLTQALVPQCYLSSFLFAIYRPPPGVTAGKYTPTSRVRRLSHVGCLSCLEPVTAAQPYRVEVDGPAEQAPRNSIRSEEHTSELQSHSFISYAVFCLKKINK